MKRRRVALVVKRSSWRVWVEERKDPDVLRLLARKDPTVSKLLSSHEEHQRTVGEVQSALDELGAETTTIPRSSATFDARRFDLVVTVGGDGTLLNASHNVDDAPILAVNSAPSYSVGFFCGARAGRVRQALAAALDGTLRRTVLSRMVVRVDGAVVFDRILNDALFCHASPAATSRYLMELGRVREEQKSSGFWIGPAAGSTAAQRSAGGRVLPLTSKDLQLVVREPYTPHGERYKLRRALVHPAQRLVVRSKIADAKIFFDGSDHAVSVGRGAVVEFARSADSLTLLGIGPRRSWGRR